VGKPPITQIRNATKIFFKSRLTTDATFQDETLVKPTSEMLRQAQHDNRVLGVILSSSKDLGVLQSSP